MPVKSTLAHLGAVIGAGLMLCTASAANAAIIFDNGPSTHASARASDFDFPFQVSSDFTFAAPQVIRDVHWWGAYGPGNTPPAQDDFTIRIFTITAGVPEVSPSILDLHVGNVSRTATGDTIGIFDEFSYSVQIPDLAIAAGGTYLLSIVNNTVLDIDDSWFWSVSNGSGDSFVRTLDGAAWGAADSEFAFNLTNDIAAVPEPATLALFGIGLAGLGVARRRKAA